ncbi:unnamed protein product [Ixodes hexagonus]
MAENKKLRILRRGVKEQLFAGLVRNPPKTIAEFVAEATTIERTLDVRMKSAIDRHQRFPPPTPNPVELTPRRCGTLFVSPCARSCGSYSQRRRNLKFRCCPRSYEKNCSRL